ncbi:unnamed protein product (macronuclear) [Paramecium tetraurelia]|uniref:ubiquitinyl hydrolase 1 n=1 Tax=Paramecium tetraurelia TaxID=5888 RepID=A0BHL8_PARTE|nr:uncharacterized protein GSPATT00029070001 [Paramecium tetraurelia]CAK58035.1 unnamed protein product [Paramecium tetraurelia]|eukprot:XP_001425433.1 hypothetical protein (macronuclear) [Paramecium tetraurelia strain d4-2]
MKTPINQDLLDQYVGMGFSKQLITMAWEESNTEADVINTLLTLSDKNNALSNTPTKQDEDIQLNQALIDSYKTNPQAATTTFEIVSPEQRKRNNGVPCGLKNVGNTCYFNGLLQTYFFNSDFVKIIIKFQPPAQIDQGKQGKSIQLVLNLQQLFLSMIGSDKKYVDPSDVVKSICDDFGNVLPIGDQKDVGEFNHYFLSRIGEGLAQNEHQPSKIEDQPHEGSSSILRLKSSTIHDEDVVSKLFFCKVHHHLQFDQAGVPQSRDSNVLYNFIPINLKDANLYDGLENFVINSVEDFKNDLSEIVCATNYNWIQGAPQTLSFQIQRVDYCKEKHDLIKQNDEFYFEEEIYLDRFLNENSKRYLEIRTQIKELIDKQKKIKQEQQSFSKFDDKYDLQDILQTVVKFLEIQNNSNTDNPANFGYSDQKHTIEQLQKYSQHVQKRKEVLQCLYNDLEGKIQESYNNFKKYKYHLQSILIHEGMANSGHYYTYIKDFRLNKWFKFNDIHVTEETREKVFQDAIGVKPGINAYLLVYVKSEFVQDELKYPKRLYQTSTEKDYLKDGYGDFLNPQQRDSIIRENQLFQNEVEDYKQARIIDRIVESYQSRFEFVNEHTRTLTNKYQSIKFKPLFTLNFPIYIKCKATQLSNQNTQHDNLIKWIILDSALREVPEHKEGIFGGQLSENFKNKILNKFKAQFNEFKRPSDSLTPSEQNDLNKFEQEYLNYVNFGAWATLVLDYLSKAEFIKALQVLQCLTKKVKPLEQQNYFFKFTKNLKTLLPIIIIGRMIPKESEVILKELQLLQAYLVHNHFQYDDPKFWQAEISIMLNAIIENHDEQQGIKEIIVNFEAGNKIKEQMELLEFVSEEIHNQQIIISTSYEVYFWSAYPKQDIIFDKLIEGMNTLKQLFDPYIKIQLALIKEVNQPLMKEELEKMIK